MCPREARPALALSNQRAHQEIVMINAQSLFLFWDRAGEMGWGWRKEEEKTGSWGEGKEMIEKTQRL